MVEIIGVLFNLFGTGVGIISNGSAVMNNQR